ncbi:MAG: sulfatase-like hydrolase/transferase, partial [bacterium]|nr:sulfatase-like hydrolase/transferase [bacterium]
HANGQYGHQHSYHHFSAFPNVRSLPVLLSEAGYRTTCAGKYHVAPEEVYHFDAYIGRKGKSPAGMADACRNLIAADDDNPFFLYFCTSEPHRPFHRDGSDPVKPEEVIVPPYLPDSPECREELAQYYGSVQRADGGVLRLIEILKETGRWEDTLIIYVSDNGIAFPGAKTTLYEPGMHLPCVVRNPFQEKQGVVCDAMVTWADITPTVLDFAEATPKDYAFHGRSFLPVLGKEDPEGWDEIYASHTFHEITMYYPMRVVRGRRYKLIWNIAHGLDYPFASDLWDSKTWQGVVKRGETHYAKR